MYLKQKLNLRSYDLLTKMLNVKFKIAIINHFITKQHPCRPGVGKVRPAEAFCLARKVVFYKTVF